MSSSDEAGYMLIRVPADQVRKAELGQCGTPSEGEWVWLASREDWDVGPFEVAGADAARDARRERYRRVFALQQQARDLGGRHIISCGSGWRGSLYGAVAATDPGPGLPSRRDSWRCHHEHPDDLAALECALGEVRRLAGAGRYEPCSAGSGCQDEFCRRDWKRLNPAQ